MPRTVKHTPGPWEVDLDEDAPHPAVRNIRIYEATSLPNARLQIAEHVAGPDSAALIASAPKMKADIECSRWLLRELLSRVEDPEWRGRIEAQIGASDKVLAKAGVLT